MRKPSMNYAVNALRNCSDFNCAKKGCFSVFYGGGSNPCDSWGIHRRNGHAKRVNDEDIKSLTMELVGCNVSTTYMFIPRDPKISLGIKLPFLVLLIKNLHKYFSFEIKIQDDQKFMRRFRVSNFQSKTTVKPFCTAMPMGLSPGWNQIHFNLADITRRAYGTAYIEAVRLEVHANARIRRIYFTDKLYTEEELPNEFRLIPRVLKKPVVEYKVPAARPPSPAKIRASKSRIFMHTDVEAPTIVTPEESEFEQPRLSHLYAETATKPGEDE